MLTDIVPGDKNWWAFYTAQSMTDNLGFTLTPDNMAPFRDAVWPLLLMSFLGFAGETLYPVFLRLIFWTTSKLAPRDSPMRESCAFLLNHPRRCYTLLFPGGTTWALFGIIFALSFVDTLLIVVLDWHNPEVASLSVGKRVVAALFQAVASRHAGMTPYTLSKVHPAVQFSLLVMMYISIYPVALSVRTSNTYEERSVSLYASEAQYDEKKGFSYLLRHMQQQLSFDLWYIFLGIFLLAVSESSKIQDRNEPSFEIFPIFFEVVSAYANVGISLGHPSTTASLSAKFSVVGKLIICAMMIRGRHRALPSKLDRAVMLPDEYLLENPEEEPL
ncbi:cation transport protein [Hirsutella rhossiliensis]|uniref:Cation transport protein n=1 Tax=Hirsutella rhossiliensis TaxID=111463 RepID=A0A9P8MX28_9HYPO|nr:cation transport protein [Hirsutella rhossiliensis]KAH0963673.1 cation transport protein [Hirsutella rhossiliensis]